MKRVPALRLLCELLDGAIEGEVLTEQSRKSTNDILVFTNAIYQYIVIDISHVIPHWVLVARVRPRAGIVRGCAESVSPHHSIDIGFPSTEIGFESASVPK
jgi:hypothetical protein